MRRPPAIAAPPAVLPLVLLLLAILLLAACADDPRGGRDAGAAVRAAGDPGSSAGTTDAAVDSDTARGPDAADGAAAGSAAAGNAAAGNAAAGLVPAGSSWRLVGGLAGVDAAAAGITLEFDEHGSVNGSGGCNRYRAPLQVGTDGVRLGPAMATKRGCAPALNAAEAAYFAALERVRSLVEAGDVLLLSAPDGLQLEFARD